MKHIILTLTAIITLASCQSEKDKVVDFARNQMKDPKSFELVKAEIRDTIHLSDVYKMAVLQLGDEAVGYYDQALKSYQTAKLFVSSSYINDYVSEGNEYRKYGELLIKRKDSIEVLVKKVEGTDKDTIVCVDWGVRCYANNSYGQRGMGQYIVHLYPNGTMDLEEYKTPEQKRLESELKVLEKTTSLY